ncbi:MAG: Fe-S cluster assembly protein SufD [Bacteroidia bacterium]|nr:Fe-S cluster assembly protein SufD [Bacteroidia bacterium]
MASTIDQHKASFLEALQTSAAEGSSARTQAREALETLEVPTRKWEDWKYTQVRDLLKASYTTSGLAVESTEGFLIPDLEGDVLVFVNGRFSPALSTFGSNGDNMHIAPMGHLSELLSGVVDTHLGELISDSNIFTATNTAYADQGVVIFVPNGKIAEHPIQIIHINHPGAEALASQHRNLFVVGKHAVAKVAETYFSIGEGTSFRNQVDELIVLDNGELEYVKIENESDQASIMGHTYGHLGRDSKIRMFTLTFSGELVRNNLHLKLAGENVNAQLNGVYLIDGSQHVDNYTKVDHAEPHCYSNELYKGIITGSATGVFSGYIHVWPDAQKTNAFQSNRNILLSDNANMYTKPQLEIYADDVKCSHGATTGRIDEGAIFYLRARGIPELEAQKMMIHAFTMETVESLSMEPVLAYIEEKITGRF